MAAYWSDDPQVNDTTSLDSHGGEREEENILNVENPSVLGFGSEDLTESEHEDDIQRSSRPPSSQLLAYHGSCPKECKRRLFTGVIYHCQKDNELARQVQKQLEKQELTYRNGNFPVRISLLGDVTAKTDIESLNEICKNEMTEVFIILCTANHENDRSSHTMGLKITNTVSKSQSFVAIELYFDEALMRGNTPELLQRVLYRPNEPAFQEKMKKILMGTSFQEEIKHTEVRQRCQKKRGNDFQGDCTRDKKNRNTEVRQRCQKKRGNDFQGDCTRDKKNRKTSQKKRSSQPAQRNDKSTTESDGSFFRPCQTSSAMLRDRCGDSCCSLTEGCSTCPKQSQFTQNSTDTPFDTSLPKGDGTAHLKQRADIGSVKDSGSNKKIRKPGTLQQPTFTGSECDVTVNRASSQHTSGKRKSDQTDKMPLQLDRDDPEQQADDRRKTDHWLTRNQTKIPQAESQTMSCDSSSSDHTRKRQISHFQKKPVKSLKQNLPSKSSTDISEASSSSASERFSGNREIKHVPLLQKHYIQQETCKKEFKDHQYACSLQTHQQHDNNDSTSPGGISHGRNSEGTSHYKQYPPRLPGNSRTKPMAAVPPHPRNPSNNEEEEDDDDSEQTVRKTPYTFNTVQETLNIFSGSGTDDCDVLPQLLPPTQVSVTTDNSQPNSTASSPRDFETEGPSQSTSVPAMETRTTDNEAEGGESGRRRPIRRLLSRLRSGLRSLSCSSGQLQDRSRPHKND